MKKFFVILAAAILFAAVLLTNTSALDMPDSPNLTLARYAHILNIDSGLTVYEKNADEPIAPASAVKIMTAILAYEHFDGRFDTVLTVSKEAVDATEGNSIGLVAGEEVTVDQLLTALIAGGANDAANVFAIEISGSIEAFVELMNKKAAEIGATSTTYENVSGIDSEGMRTTARDTSLIAAYAYKLPEYAKYAGVTRYVMPATNKSGKRVVHNRNYLLSTHIERKYYDKNAIGLNSGYTQLGGHCVVTATENGGLTYIITVMGGGRDDAGDNVAFYTASELIKWASGSFGYVTVLDPDSIVKEIPVSLAKNVDYVIASPENKVDYFLPLDTDARSEISYEMKLDRETMTAPIYEGQRAGEIDVVYKGEVIATVQLITKNNVRASSFLRALDYLKNLLKSRQVKIALTVFAVVFTAYLVLSYVAFTRRRRRNRRR